MTPSQCCLIARCAQPNGRAWLSLPPPPKCQRGEARIVTDGIEYRNCICGSTITLDLEDRR